MVSLTNVKRLGALALVSIAIVALAAACGDGGGLSEEDELATAVARLEAGVPPTAVPPDFDPETIDLQRVEGDFESYSIAVPEGWDVVDSPQPDGFGRVYYLDEGEGPVAQLFVRCSLGADAETLIWQDNQVATNLDALQMFFDLANAVDVTVNGMSGRIVDSSVGLAGGMIEQRVVYLDGEQCGWRIALWSSGLGSRAHFAPLFDRVIESFSEQPFDAPDVREPLRPPDEG